MNVTDLEQTLLSEVSRTSLWEHADALARWERISGTPDERAAVDYLKRSLDEYGVATKIYEFESLLGWPEEAELAVGDRTVEVISHAFAPSTPEAGVEAEVVDAGTGEDSELAAADPKGKVAIVDGLASPLRVLRAQQAGAVGLIFVSQDRLHDMCLSPVWGTPTTRTASLLPRIPIVSVRSTDAEQLKAIAGDGASRVRIRTKTFWGWRTTPLLVGEVTADVVPEQFVLLSGHHCSWYYGAMDNGAANATMLECARILAHHRRDLRRTVRIAFWPGHTQGRYSGSTWYFDNFWEDLHDNCVLHINVDSTGAKGANIYHALCMPETSQLAVDAVRDASGYAASPERQPRAGDQSFWSCGVPSIYMDLSHVPLEQAVGGAMSSGLFTSAETSTAHDVGGLPWWWHTPDDTIDKIDPEVLERDTKIYLLATLRIATAGLLPFRYEPAARQIREAIEAYGAAAASRIDLTLPSRRAAELQERTAELDALLVRASARTLTDETVTAINRHLMRMDRELVMLNFTGEAPFDQDLAIPIPTVPLLAPVHQLIELEATSDEARFLATQLVRNRNKVAYQLRVALNACDEASRALRET